MIARISSLTWLAAAALVVLTTCPAASTTIELAGEEVGRVTATSPGGQFGHALAVGDLNGDGANELLIGSPALDVGASGPQTGAVYVIDGSLFDGSAPVMPSLENAAMIAGSVSRGRLGAAMAVADIDGDGNDDVVLCAPEADVGDRIACGAVYVIPGPAALRGGSVDTLASAVLHGAEPGDMLGSEALAAELFGPGEISILLSAPRAGSGDRYSAGAVYVVDGQWLTNGGRSRIDEASRLVIDGEAAGDALLGMTVSDTDGDGKRELVLGAYHADGDGDTDIDVGIAYILPSDSLLVATHLTLPERASCVIRGERPRGLLGRAMASGDMDADGADELALAAYTAGREGKKETAWGDVYVIMGSPNGLPSMVDLSSEIVHKFTGTARWDVFGLPLVLEDINRDGHADLLAASQFADCVDADGRRCGRVHLFRGSLTSVVAAKAGPAEFADAVLVGASPFDMAGGAIAIGDVVAGDSPDIIIGAPDAAIDDDDKKRGSVFVVPGELIATAR